MQLDFDGSRKASLAIALLLLVSLLAPFGSVSGSDGGTPRSYLGGGTYFSDVLPLGPGQIVVDYHVPFFQDPAPGFSYPGYKGLELTIPSHYLTTEAADDPLASVIGVAACPAGSPNWRPADEACVELTQADTPGPGEYKLYLRDPDGAPGTIAIEPSGDNHQSPLRITLRLEALLTPPATPEPPFVTDPDPYGIKTAFYTPTWEAPSGSTFYVRPDFATATGLRVFFLDAGATEADTVSVPQILRAGETRTYYTRGIDAAGNLLARTTSTWAFADDACGAIGAPALDGSILFTALNVTGGTTPLDCSLEVTWDGQDGQSGDITVLAGNADRFVVITDTDSEEIDVRDIVIGAPTRMQLAIYDAHQNIFLGHGVAQWHTDGDCGTVEPAIGPDTVFTPTAFPDEHCHVHAVLVEDEGLHDETGELAIVRGDTRSIDFAGEPTSLGAGVVRQFAATAYNEYGYAIDDPNIVYSGNAANIITPAGLFKTNAQGTYELTASNGTVVSDPHVLTITAGPGKPTGSSLTIDTATATADGEDAITATITAIDEFGNPTEGGEDDVVVTLGGDEFTAAHVSGNTYSATITTTTAGDYTLGATLNGDALATTYPVTFNPGPVASLTVAPDDQTFSADSPQTVPYTATATDANGNVVPIDSATDVSWDVDGGGSFTGNDLTTGTTAGDYTVTATHTATAVTDTTGFTIEPGIAVAATASPATTTITAGDAAPITYTVSATDAHGNAVDVDPVTEITWEVEPAGGDFADNVLTPSAVAGTYTITGTLADGPVVEPTLTIEPAAIATLDVIPSPISSVVGSDDLFVLDATGKDPHGNLITLDDTTEVIWSLDNESAGTLSGNTFTTGTSVGSFVITATLAHTHELPEAIAHANGEPHVTEEVPVEILPAPYTHFVLECDPCSATAGDPVVFELRAENDLAQVDPIDVPVNFTFGGPSASPFGDVAECGGVATGADTEVTFTDGVASVSCTFFAAETFALSAVNGTESGVSAGVTIDAGAFHMVDATCATPIVAGQTSACEAFPVDAYGNPTTGGTPSWSADVGTFSSTTGTDVVYYPPTEDGTYPVTATIGALESRVNVVVAPADAVSIVLNVPYGTTGAADPAVGTFDIVAWVNDTFGNPVHGKTLHWDILHDSTGVATLSAASTTVVDGMATVTLTTGTVLGETFSVEVVDDLDDPKLIRRSGTIEVLPGALADITWVCQSGCPATAGASATFAMTMSDGIGNLLDSGPHAFDGVHAVVLGGATDAPDGTPATCTDVDGVEITFGQTTNLSFTSGSGSVTCTFYANETAPVTVTARAVTNTTEVLVAAAPAVGLRLSGEPTDPVLAGTCALYTVSVHDTYGNVAAGTHTVTFTDEENGTVLDACAGTGIPSLEVSSGTADFAFRDQIAEVVNLTLSAAGLVGESLDLAFEPAVADRLVLSCTGCATAGEAFDLALTAKDAYGNVLSHGPNHYTGTQTLDFAGAVASPSGDAPTCAGAVFETDVEVAFVDGEASVSCTLFKAGTIALSATDADLLTGTRSTTVAPAVTNAIIALLPGMTYDAATQTVSGAPVDQVAGVRFELTLAAYDVYGNLADEDDDLGLSLSGALAGPDGTAPNATDKDGAFVDFGTLTMVSFTDGAATTSVGLFLNETVGLTAAADGFGSTEFDAFDVQVGAFGSIGIFDCDPRDDGRDCLLAGPGAGGSVSYSTFEFVEFKAGRMDAHGNILENPLVSVSWESLGLTPPITAESAAGVSWVPEEAGSGTLTISRSGVPNTVLDILVTA